VSAAQNTAQSQPAVRGIDALRSQAANSAPRAGQTQTRQGPAGPRLAPPVAPEAHMPQISIGFGDLASWEFTQRVARGLATSTMVPENYRLMVPKKFKRDELVENPNAIANCIIALNMAQRLRADVLMIMQNLFMIEGKPSWSAQFVISALNGSGLFSRLQFEMTDLGDKEVDYVSYQWDDATRSKVPVTSRVKIRDKRCIAWAIDKETNTRVESAPVSIELAVKEGWYTKNGSKWQTMPELMLTYRSGAFFGRVHAPELLMGLRTVDEANDIIEAEMAEDGSWKMAEEGKPETDVAGTDTAGAPAAETANPAADTDKPATNTAAAGHAQIAHEQTIGLTVSQLIPEQDQRVAVRSEPVEGKKQQSQLFQDDGFGSAE